MLSLEQEIVETMNAVLNTTTIQERFEFLKNVTMPQDGKTVIIPATSPIHKVLENYMYPSFKELIVYHYTSDEAAQNIKANNTFRFYSILKRYGEGELTPFLQKFGFDEAFDALGKLKYLSDYEHIFYASFVKAPVDNINTEEMDYLSAGHETRLKFRIRSAKNFFRKINYENDEKYNLFLELKKIANEYGKEFLVEGMSGRFASFCISEDYKIENEYRAYWRHWSDCDGFTVKEDEDGNKYIEIPLGEDNFSGITVELLDC